MASLTRMEDIAKDLPEYELVGDVYKRQAHGCLEAARELEEHV